MPIIVLQNGKQYGPYELYELSERVSQGSFSPTDLCWQDGWANWMPISTALTPPSILPAAFSVSPASPLKQENLRLRPGIRNAFEESWGPQGVGGWLLFFCVLLTIVSPLISGLQLKVSWEMAQPTLRLYPDLKDVIVFENYGTVFVLGYGMIVGLVIWTGNPSGREIAKTYLLIRFVGFIGIEFYAFNLLDGVGQNISNAVFKGMIMAGGRELVFLSIWWAYFAKSRRVANTYG